MPLLLPQKIPLDIFKEIVQSSKENCLPEFYVISEQGKYIGYILLLADKKEDIPKPFTFLACHNGDTLPKETHKKNIGIYRQTVSCKQLE